MDGDVAGVVRQLRSLCAAADRAEARAHGLGDAVGAVSTAEIRAVLNRDTVTPDHYAAALREAITAAVESDHDDLPGLRAAARLYGLPEGIEPGRVTVYPPHEGFHGRCPICGTVRWATDRYLNGDARPAVQTVHCNCCTHPHNLPPGNHPLPPAVGR